MNGAKIFKTIVLTGLLATGATVISSCKKEPDPISIFTNNETTYDTSDINNCLNTLDEMISEHDIYLSNLDYDADTCLKKHEKDIIGILNKIFGNLDCDKITEFYELYKNNLPDGLMEENDLSVDDYYKKCKTCKRMSYLIATCDWAREWFEMNFS